MRKLILTSILIFSGMGLAQASDPSDVVAAAAHRLDDAASHFYQEVKHSRGRGHLARDAKQFSEVARHFHRGVEQRGNYRQMQAIHAELISAYAHVREELGERGSPRHERHLRGDFRKVESAFQDLNRAIDHVRERYAHNRPDGRYYRGNDGSRRHDRAGGRYDSGLTITFRGIFGS